MVDYWEPNFQAEKHPSIRVVPIDEVELLCDDDLPFPTLKHRPTGKIRSLIGAYDMDYGNTRLLAEINKKVYQHLQYAKPEASVEHA